MGRLSFHRALFSLQRLISGVLDANLKEWSLKEVVVMVNMIGVLSRHLEEDSAEVGVVKWVWFVWSCTVCS